MTQQRDTLLELAERVGTASGRWYDHDLDADIYEELGYAVIRRPSSARGICWRHRGHGPLGYVSHWVGNHAFTYKLDDALKLVPEGWDAIGMQRFDNGTWSAMLAGNDAHLMAEDPDEFFVEAEGITGALALAAASLKALASQQDNQT